MQANGLPTLSESLDRVMTVDLRQNHGSYQDDELGELPEDAPREPDDAYEMYGPWKIAMMRRMYQMVSGLLAPRNQMEAAFYAVMNALAQRRKRVTPMALELGFSLAAAQAQGVGIWTPARDLAKQAKVRYQTMLLVKRLALVELKARGLFGPETAEENGNL